MRIRKYSDLKHGQEYWYISVEYNCHWNISIHNFVFDSKVNVRSSMWRVIIYDNKREARIFKYFLQRHINIYIMNEKL